MIVVIEDVKNTSGKAMYLSTYRSHDILGHLRAGNTVASAIISFSWRMRRRTYPVVLFQWSKISLLHDYKTN